MKRILFLFGLLLVSVLGMAQAPSNYTNINGRYRWIAGMFDSTFHIPKGTTPSLRTGGSTNAGALFYKTGDSTVRYWTGSQWLRLADSTRYVPYTGATQNVNLGQYGLKTKYVEFDTSSRDVTDRTLLWSNDDGVLKYGMTNGGSLTQRIGLEQFARVKNVDATQINKGDVVYIFGASGDRASVKKADNRQDATSSKTLGVAAENIAVNDVGFVATFGVVGNLNLAAYTPGDILYLDSIPGQVTKTKPQAPYHMVFVGVVERANAGDGRLFVNVQNGYELDELHNVKITSPVNNKAILAYDSVKALWVDTTFSAIGIGTVSSVATNNGTGITGGTITTSGTLAIDTAIISTRAWRQKGIDSVAALINGNVSGTTNYIPKFTGTNTIGNSVIYESSGNIGINTTSPASASGYTTLTLNNAVAGGNLVFQLNGSDKGSIYNTSSDLVIEVNSGATIFKNGSGEQMRLTSGGSLGIGTSSPSYPVHAYSTSNARIGVQGTTNFSAFQNINSSGSLYWGIDDNAGANFTGVAYGRFIYSSGAYPLSFFTNSTERMRLDASGNLGLGVTPSAWGSGRTALQIGNTNSYFIGSQNTVFGNNAYNDGTNWRYITSYNATLFTQAEGGSFAWYNAPSGTAGNAISFTQAMTLDASGRLGIGTTSPAEILDVRNSYREPTSGEFTQLVSSTTTQDAGRGGSIGFGGYYSGTSSFASFSGIKGAKENGDGGNTAGNLIFYTRPNAGAVTERMRITSVGNVGIGTSSPSNLLSISSTANNTSQIDLSGFLGDTKGHIGSYARSFYLSTNWYYNGSQNADNTGYGQAAVELSGSEGAAIFLTSAAGSTVPSERMRITSGGEVLIGTTTDAGDYKLQVNGNTYFAGKSTVSANVSDYGAAIINNNANSYGLYIQGGGTYAALDIYNYSGGTALFQVTGAGSTYNATGTYGTISDARLKTNVVNTSNKLNDLLKLNIVDFNYIYDSTTTYTGMIAQEVEAILPHMVETNDKGFKAIKTSLFIPYLIKSIQELKAEIETLKNK